MLVVMMHDTVSSTTPDQRLEALRHDLAGFKPRSLVQLEQLVVEAREERARIGNRMAALINENQKAPVPKINEKMAAAQKEIDAASAIIRLRKAALEEVRSALRPKLAALLDRHLLDIAPDLTVAVQTIDTVRDLLRETERFGAFAGIELPARAYLAPDKILLAHFLQKVTSK